MKKIYLGIFLFYCIFDPIFAMAYSLPVDNSIYYGSYSVDSAAWSVWQYNSIEIGDDDLKVENDGYFYIPSGVDKYTFLYSVKDCESVIYNFQRFSSGEGFTLLKTFLTSGSSSPNSRIVLDFIFSNSFESIFVSGTQIDFANVGNTGLVDMIGTRTSSTPLPGALLLLGTGIVGFVGFRKRYDRTCCVVA